MGLLDQLNEVLLQTPRKYWGDKATRLGSLLSDSAATGAQAYGSANSPMAPEHSQTLAGLLADFTPVVGDVKSAYDGMQSAREGDYLGAALGGLGALPLVPNLGGVMKMGPDWIGKSKPSLDKLAKNKGKFLYHSSDPANLDNLHYGIEPQQGGPWVREVANGTGVDDVEDMLSKTTPLAWMSDSPSWVKAFVSRVSGKPQSSVTPDDIEKYGHLAIINKRAPDTGNVYKIGDQGLSNGEYSTVENLRGKKMNAYETPLYGEDNFGNKLEPFGVERSEYVTTDSVSPMLQLTGKELVEFLRKAGLLGQ